MHNCNFGTQCAWVLCSKVAILANLSPDSGIWRILKAFGYKYVGLAIFRKHLAPNFLVWRNVRPVYLHVFAYIYVDLQFLSLLMVCKFMTSNESVKVFKVEA